MKNKIYISIILSNSLKMFSLNWGMLKRVGVDGLICMGDDEEKPTYQKGGNLILLFYRKCIVRHARVYQVSVCVCVRVCNCGWKETFRKLKTSGNRRSERK